MHPRILPALAIALLLAGCATRPTHPDAFSFAVMGDTQYNAREEAEFVEMLRRIDREEDIAFVVHVGDIVGSAPCSDALYERRRAEFGASAHSFILTPGDNEWVDCREPARGAHDPAERLAKLREAFFRDRRALGGKRMDTLAQDRCVEEGAEGCFCGAVPENRYWSRAGVRFVTLSVPGSENNLGSDGESNREVECRNLANARWLEQAVATAVRTETRAMVIFMHANPFNSRQGAYRALLRQIEEIPHRIEKPVLLVHGDTHAHRIDAPFVDSYGNSVPITRLETFGSPLLGWIKVTVDPDSPRVFSFDARLHKIVAP